MSSKIIKKKVLPTSASSIPPNTIKVEESNHLLIQEDGLAAAVGESSASDQVIDCKRPQHLVRNFPN